MKKGYKDNIEKVTLENTNFRKVLYTATNCQLVVMSLKVGEEIGIKTHTDNDQVFRFESGEGKVIINGNEYVEPCREYREEICLQGSFTNSNGETESSFIISNFCGNEPVIKTVWSLSIFFNAS